MAFNPYTESELDFFALKGDLSFMTLGESIAKLSESELIIVWLMATTCLEDKHIAFVRCTSWHTAKNQMLAIRAKLKVNNRSALVLAYWTITSVRELIDSRLKDSERFEYARARLAFWNDESKKESRARLYTAWIETYNNGSYKLYD